MLLRSARTIKLRPLTAWTGVGTRRADGELPWTNACDEPGRAVRLSVRCTHVRREERGGRPRALLTAEAPAFRMTANRLRLKGILRCWLALPLMGGQDLCGGDGEESADSRVLPHCGFGPPLLS